MIGAPADTILRAVFLQREGMFLEIQELIGKATRHATTVLELNLELEADRVLSRKCAEGDIEVVDVCNGPLDLDAVGLQRNRRARDVDLLAIEAVAEAGEHEAVALGRSKVDDPVGTALDRGGREYEAIGTGSALEQILSGSADEHVVTTTPNQVVVAGAAGQTIVTVETLQ